MATKHPTSSKALKAKTRSRAGPQINVDAVTMALARLDSVTGLCRQLATGDSDMTRSLLVIAACIERGILDIDAAFGESAD